MQTNNEISGEDLARAKKYEEFLSTQPAEEALAVGLIGKNVLNGCSWEFVKNNFDVRRLLDAFQKNPNCSVQTVTYNHQKNQTGYLLYMKMGRLLELLGPSCGGPLIASDVELAQKHRNEASMALVKKMQSGYSGQIGIYCTNDTQTITVKGNAYPAYSVTLKELCTACGQLGYGIVVSGQTRDPREVLAREDAVLKALLVAPSSNALFINIAPMKK